MSLPPKGRGLRVLSQSQANVSVIVTNDKAGFEVDKLRESLPADDTVLVREKSGKGLFNRVLSSLGIINKEENGLNNRRASTSVLPDDYLYIKETKTPPIPLVNFNLLGAFNDGTTTHPDFDNDILNYSYHIQARNPENLANVFKTIGGERVFCRLANHLIGLVGMVPMPTEVIYLASYYLNHTIANNPFELKDLEILALAAVQLAAKAERQGGFVRNLGYRVNMSEINRYELQILKTISFKVLPTTTIQFMRILFPTVCVAPAPGTCQESQSIQGTQSSWLFAKFLSQLLLTNTTLANLSSALQAGVVMKLVTHLSGRDCWTDVHFAILQEDASKYEENINILCRLLLVARENQHIYEIYTRNEKIVEKIVQQRMKFLIERAKQAAHVSMYEKRKVEFRDSL
ncbi:unnamed protein product [Auanema sp. JU1783]|nr:unnamed protein product [Auanema sp. JU1783]